MHVKLVDFVLFLHIGVAVATFGVAIVLLTAMVQMRNAQQISVLRSWSKIAHRIEPTFPVLVALLIGLGAWLIHLSGGEFTWSDGWVIAAVTGLVLMEAYGGIVLAPAGKKLHAMVESTPDGEVPAALRAEVRNKAVWAGSFGNMGVATGILFNMPTKPVGGWAAAIVIAVGLAGIVLGLRLASVGETAHEAAAPALATAEAAVETAG
jgi:hypothetical protein